jgi:hypothetical protein
MGKHELSDLVDGNKKCRMVFTVLGELGDEAQAATTMAIVWRNDGKVVCPLRFSR